MFGLLSWPPSEPPCGLELCHDLQSSQLVDLLVDVAGELDGAVGGGSPRYPDVSLGAVY